MLQQACFVAVVYFFYPETSNISLEDIDKIFLPPEMQEYASRHNSVVQAAEGSVSSKGDDVDHAEKADF
jgi:hypothetical protein